MYPIHCRCMKSIVYVIKHKSQNSPEICLFSDPRLTLLAWSRDTILANLRPSSMRVCCMSWRLQVMRPVVSVRGWGDEEGCNWGLISIKTHRIRQTCLSITCYLFFHQWCFTLTWVWMETNLENLACSLHHLREESNPRYVWSGPAYHLH